LPLSWARANRDALWCRALQQYLAGTPWLQTDESERSEIEARNESFTTRDPWADQVGDWLAAAPGTTAHRD
jgi:predicted P-loop ATPase